MDIITSVALVVRESREPLVGVRVALFAGGERTRREQLGIATTDQGGRALFRVPVELLVGDGGRLPFPHLDRPSTLQVDVLDGDGGTVLSTRATLRTTAGFRSITLPIAQAVALRAGLVARKPRVPVDRKRGRFRSYHQQRLRRRPTTGPDPTLCVARTLLDLLERSGSGDNDLQRRADEALRRRIPDEQLQRVRAVAGRGRDLIDELRLSDLTACGADSDPDDLARIFMAPEGPLETIVKSLSSTAPPPDTDLGDPAPGTPFAFPFDEWVKDCAAAFEQGELDGEAQQQMEEWFESGLLLLAPPSVNLIDVYDPGLRNYVRHGRPSDKTLELKVLDPVDGWRGQVQDMRVPLDGPTCLVLQEDVADESLQVLAVDVAPGQTVRLLGSGFIDSKASVRCRFARWNGVDDGRLVPSGDQIPVFGFDGSELDVHGSETPPIAGDTPENFLGDRIVFDWPDVASEPGLYRLELRFANTTDLPSRAEQNPDTCLMSLGRGELTAQVLWFAVLPPADDRRVRVRATEVECVDETDPEEFGFINYFDDVEYVTAGDVSRLRIDPDEPEAVTIESVDSNTDAHNHWFWDDGDVWSEIGRVLPAGDDPFRLLRADEIMTLTLLASEVEGETDRIVLRWLVVALVILVLILVVAVLVAVVVILVVLEVITAGLATAIIPIVATIATALFGVVLTGAIAAIEAVFADLPAGDAVALVMPQFSGPELSHRLSPVRFHQVLWLHERPPLPEGSLPTTRETTLETEALIERYRCTAAGLGSIYELEIVVDAT